MEMITRLTMTEEQMPEWKRICKTWARKHNAELIFVDNQSFGVEINGQLQHIYIDELAEMLKGELV